MKKRYALASSFYFLFIFIVVPGFSFAAIIIVGHDPINDILCSESIEGIYEFFDEAEPPSQSEWEDFWERAFDLSARPNYIDVTQYGFNNSDTECKLYVQVEDITDTPTCSNSAFLAIIFYNDTIYNEQIAFFGVAYNATFNASYSIYWCTNQDGSNHVDNIVLDTANNRYEFIYPCSWITEDDASQLYQLTYGLLATFCFNDTGAITSFCVDVFPNDYWNNQFPNSSSSNPFGPSNTDMPYSGSGDTNPFDPTVIGSIFWNNLWLWIILIIAFLGIMIYAFGKGLKSK